MRSIIFSVVFLLSLGCQAKAPVFQHAVVPELSTEALSELQTIIGIATGSPKPLITRTAFASTHILVLEHAIATTPKGRIATGRTVTRPEVFHLLGNGRQCVLQRVNSGQRYPLTFKCVVRKP